MLKSCLNNKELKVIDFTVPAGEKHVGLNNKELKETDKRGNECFFLVLITKN